MSVSMTGRGVVDVGTSQPPDLRRWSRLFAALLIPVGPAAVAVLRFVLPYDTTDEPSAVVGKVAAHQDTQSIVVWLGFLALLTLVPGVLWVARITRRAAPRLTAAAVLLAVPAYLSISVLVAGDAAVWFGVREGVDDALVARMYEAMHPSALVATGIFVVGHVLGTVLLGIAMWISRAVPRWAALLTLASQPLHFVAAVILANHAVDFAAWGMNAVGFAAASVAIVRMHNDDWDLAPRTVHT